MSITGVTPTMVALIRMSRIARIHVPNRVLQRSAEIIQTHIVRRCPVGKGTLSASVQIESGPDYRTVYTDAPHAIFVEEGTKESEGRYVPAIGKRLVDKELSVRREVFKYARSMYIPEQYARVALRIPITTGRLPKYIAGRHVGKVTQTGKRRPGKITINENLTKKQRRETTRHELQHAVEFMTGTGWGREQTYQIEKRARAAAIEAGKMRKNIGKHPGIKATHFFRDGIEDASDEVDRIIIEGLDEIIENVRG